MLLYNIGRWTCSTTCGVKSANYRLTHPPKATRGCHLHNKFTYSKSPTISKSREAMRYFAKNCLGTSTKITCLILLCNCLMTQHTIASTSAEEKTLLQDHRHHRCRKENYRYHRGSNFTLRVHHEWGIQWQTVLLSSARLHTIHE